MVEWAISEAVRTGKLGDFLKPYLEDIASKGTDTEKAYASSYAASIPAAAGSPGGVSAGDGDVMADLLNRHVNGG